MEVLTNNPDPLVDQWADVFESEHHSSEQIPAQQVYSINGIEHAALDTEISNQVSVETPLGVISDVPRLCAAHEAAGYREGISESKERFIQEGFDEGYVLGAEIGYAAGFVLAALESLVFAIAGQDIGNLKVNHDLRETLISAPNVEQISADSIESLIEQARIDLSGHRLFMAEFFDQEGVWRWEADNAGPENANEDTLSLQDIAMLHPLIKKWLAELDKLDKLPAIDANQLPLRPSRR